METLVRINLTLAGAGISLCILGLSQALASRVLVRGMRRYFVTFFSIILAYVLCTIVSEATEGNTDWRVFTKIGMFGSSALSSMLLPMLLGILLYTTEGDRYWRNPLFITAVALWLAYMGLLVYTQFSTAIYYYDEANVYHRGPLYQVLLLGPVLIVFVNLLALQRRWRKLAPKVRRAYLIYFLVPLFAMLIQMMLFGVMTVSLGTTIAAFCMFANMLSDQRDRFYQQEQENVQLKTDIMLTQIQPHFLYNTLGAIQSLCATDPKAAEKAIAKFSRYLRGNMDSINHGDAIPFERELMHTKIYLELEQLRYEDALTVAYDLETMDFTLPPLTLQPLAENAVRHGIRKKQTGSGTVTIQTRAYADRTEVSVLDDGPGFDPERPPQDGRTHIGLMNVRTRLEHAAHGQLRIESSAQGTRATIVLPKEG